MRTILIAAALAVAGCSAKAPETTTRQDAGSALAKPACPKLDGVYSLETTKVLKDSCPDFKPDAGASGGGVTISFRDGQFILGGTSGGCPVTMNDECEVEIACEYRDESSGALAATILGKLTIREGGADGFIGLTARVSPDRVCSSELEVTGTRR